MDACPRMGDDVVLRLDTAFIGHTTGAGVVRDTFGRITRRFGAETRGCRDEAYGAIILDETFAFDDGEVEVQRWVITAAGPHRYVLAEAHAGSGIVAQSHNGEVVFAYSRPVGTEQGLVRPRFCARLTLLWPNTVLKTVKVSLLGVPLATVTGVLQRAR